MRVALVGQIVGLSQGKTDKGKEYTMATVLQTHKNDKGEVLADTVRVRCWNGAARNLVVGKDATINVLVRAYLPKGSSNPVLTADAF